MDINKIKNKLSTFSKDRNWDQYHTPKNLSMALSVEASELLEIFQWMKDDDSSLSNLSDEDKKLAAEELADIQIYLLRLCDKLNVDIENEVLEKIKKNSDKYPINLSKNNAIKYNRR